MKSLRFVLAATVRGARGSRVPLTSGSLAPSGTDVTGSPVPPDFHPSRVAAHGHDLLTLYASFSDHLSTFISECKAFAMDLPIAPRTDESVWSPRGYAARKDLGGAAP